MASPPKHALTDVELLARVGSRDDAALEALFARYGGACYSLARRILADDTLAQDVVQEVFLACWQGAAYDRSRGAVSSWLLSITHHKAVDCVRREQRVRARRAPDDALASLAGDASPEDGAWATVRADAVRAALQDLPPEQREVVLLAYYGGYSQREVSALTGIPLGTVKTRTLAAMRRLRTLLGPAVQGDDE